MFTHDRSQFGSGFIFGTATSSYQIEGGQADGRGPSIWDSFSMTPGNVRGAESGVIACDHYNRWEEDLDLIRDAGFDAYRFSFAWPRIMPDGRGAVNAAGLAFYDRLIDGMLARGLKPFATLYHWDLPSALQDMGGWTNRDIAGWFADYAQIIGHHFGDRLHATATINEPWCVAFLSHFLGKHAPGLRDVRAAARAMHHVLLAHGTAVGALRGEGVKNLGIVLNLEATEPRSGSDADRKAAELGDGIFNRWYLDGLFKGRYPADVLAMLGPHMPENHAGDMAITGAPLDWLGINYYTRSLYYSDPAVPVLGFSQERGGLAKSDLGWEIYPEGLTTLVTRVARDYTKLPLYITENGMSETDDRRRVDFYDQHLGACLDVIRAGVDLRGYFAWSLLDNFEWAEGYASRFGLVEVDYETQKRTPKGSYRAFQGLLHNSR
ncbi:beta-glucosidase [Devosia enhydra]|uniref:Beta-glucosidase n=1 Tax=Devosia enhydra TaxID=665118 RepID=A0A1K2I1P8_9HYPH|nr:GH1 family beta-glucosidase [Devosia enhydra]SFZ86183.1 beta-glucosidase [Devosia enhydra]